MQARISPLAIAIGGLLALAAVVLLLVAPADRAMAGGSIKCGTVDAPKNNHGLSFRSQIKVSAENLGCGKSKRVLKKFVKVFNSNEQTSVMGFTCEMPQRGNGEVFYRCRKGDATAKGIPKGKFQED